MKLKLIPFMLILAFGFSTANAQGFKIGIRTGTDIQKLSGKTFSQEFAYGYHLGGAFEIGITQKFGIQPEVLFSSVNIDTGSSFSSIYKFENISKAKLQYIRIPLLLTFKPNPFMVLQVGPQYSILRSADKNLLENGQQAFKNGDFSMLGGLQINISKIRIYGRYAVGLTNLNDIDNQEKWKRQTVQLGLGLTF